MMKKAPFFFSVLLLSTFLLGESVFGLTEAEINATLSQLEGDLAALETKLAQLESGTSQVTRQGLVVEWQKIQGQIETLTNELTPPACTYTYTVGDCQANNRQTLAVSSQSPAGCVGTPETSRACTYVPPACTYTYTVGDCQANNRQTLAVSSQSPDGCVGTPETSQACTYVATPPPIDPANRTGADENVEDKGPNTPDGVDGKTPTGDQPLAPSIVTRPSDNPPGSPPVAVTTVTRGEDARRMTIAGLLARARGVLDALIPFIIGLAVFVILWGIFLYVTKAAEEEKRSEARLYIVWGIVAVFSMLSLWGFVNILVNSFNLQTTLAPSSLPTAPVLAP